MNMFNLLKEAAILSTTILILVGSGSIARAQEKQPAPKRILVIFVFKQGLPWAYRIEKSVRLAFASQSAILIEFNVEYLSGLSVESLLEKVARLPKDSAILFLKVFRDANGKTFVPQELLPVIFEKANAPIFGSGNTYLGHGIVGGSLLGSENKGKKYATIALNFFKDGPLQDLQSKGATYA